MGMASAVERGDEKKMQNRLENNTEKRIKKRLLAMTVL